MMDDGRDTRLVVNEPISTAMNPGLRPVGLRARVRQRAAWSREMLPTLLQRRRTSGLLVLVMLVLLLNHADTAFGFDKPSHSGLEKSKRNGSDSVIATSQRGRREKNRRAHNHHRGLLQKLWGQGRKHGSSAVEGVRGIVIIRGGSLASQPLGQLDLLAQSFALFLAWVVGLQATGMALFAHRDSLFELASRLMSRETVAAAKNIRTILDSVDDHGVVDIFKKYPPRDLIASIYALSRLQSACQVSERSKEEKRKGTNEAEVEEELLEDLCRYAPFASAAYGWELDLITAGRLHRGDFHALVKMTHVDPEDVVMVEWESETNRPAFFIVRDRERKRLVVSIRGTWSAHDVLTDLCCTGTDYFVGSRRHRAHDGMLAAAKGVEALAVETITAELKANSDYSLLLVGHSLGGSVAAILGQLWERRYKEVTVYAYGPACVAPMNDMKSDRIFSVMLEGDPFSSLSLGHVADVSFALAHLCENDGLRATIVMRTDGPVDALEERDVTWCNERMEELRNQLPGERLYPPGRLIFLSEGQKRKDPAHVQEVSPTLFKELKISPRMFDLSRHVPRLYEEKLRSALKQPADSNGKKSDSTR